MRSLALAAFAAALVPLAAGQAPVGPPPKSWSAVRGQVVFPEKAALPVPKVLPVNVGACLRNGPLPDEQLLVSAKTRGIQNVVVWLCPDGTDPKAKFAADEIHPADAKRPPHLHSLVVTCCRYSPRIVLARPGDTLEVRNADVMNHNFTWESANNAAFNQNLAPGALFRFPGPLVAENPPIGFKCNLHPWMAGYVRVFDHPYFALTDEDGGFTIPDAPLGTYRLVVWHEKVGFLGGAPGRFGTKVEIAGPTTRLKVTEFTGLK